MIDFKQLQKSIQEIEDLGLAEIQKSYQQALNESRQVLQKYADKYGLDYNELQKYDRMGKLKKELAEATRKGHVDASRLMRNTSREAYRESFKVTQNLIEDLSGITVQGKIKRDVVQNALQNPVSGLTLNDRLRKNRRQIISNIQETVGQGLYNGDSYSKMSKRLKSSFEGNANKAERVVRTEGHRMMEQGKHESAKHAVNQGVNVKKYWIDTSDDRTRDTHMELADKYDEDNAIPVDEPFKLGGMEAMFPGDFGAAEEDINCRCTVGYVTNKE